MRERVLLHVSKRHETCVSVLMRECVFVGERDREIERERVHECVCVCA